MLDCSNEDCDEEFSYDAGFDDPPEGAGHIEVTHNPPDDPSWMVAETFHYCSVSCLREDGRAPDYLLDSDEDGDA
ncbi:hypothetical protein [Halorussus halobius]|uniref:hypothetical protein n=1 Tax=Halorussus halobius TaxID=1710537 RepID=UPI0010921D7C|nr:hypothetical protein [Halorussus halobius]